MAETVIKDLNIKYIQVEFTSEWIKRVMNIAKYLRKRYNIDSDNVTATYLYKTGQKENGLITLRLTYIQNERT